MSNVDLKIDWCSHKAAKYAVEHWHYSGCLPAGKSAKIGAWEDGKFIGCVIFGLGSNRNMSGKYGLKIDQCCELTRIALNKHKSTVSKIASIAIRFIKAKYKGLKLIVSYADPSQGHYGGIYQAMNWIYIGKSQAQRELIFNGKFLHKRSASAKWGTASPSKIMKKYGVVVKYGPVEWKYVYLMPLYKEMRKQIKPLRKPYPKRGLTEEQQTPSADGGSSPASTLQTQGDA